MNEGGSIVLLYPSCGKLQEKKVVDQLCKEVIFLQSTIALLWTKNVELKN